MSSPGLTAVTMSTSCGIILYQVILHQKTLYPFRGQWEGPQWLKAGSPHPLDEPPVHQRALYEHLWDKNLAQWYIGSALRTFPFYQNTFHLLSAPGLKLKTLQFSAQTEQKNSTYWFLFSILSPKRLSSIWFSFVLLPGKEHNFKMNDDTVTSALGVPYDYGSVMHYNKKSFATGSEPTIITKIPYFMDIIGQRISFSTGDLSKINQLYNCSQSSLLSVK